MSEPRTLTPQELTYAQALLTWSRSLRSKQGDATKLRCGRTEFFPKNCPCQKAA